MRAAIVILIGLMSTPAYAGFAKDIKTKMEQTFENLVERASKIKLTNPSKGQKLIKLEEQSPAILKEGLSKMTLPPDDDPVNGPPSVTPVKPSKYVLSKFRLEREYFDSNWDLKTEVVCEGQMATPVFDMRNQPDDAFGELNQVLTCYGPTSGMAWRQYYIYSSIVFGKDELFGAPTEGKAFFASFNAINESSHTCEIDENGDSICGNDDDNQSNISFFSASNSSTAISKDLNLANLILTPTSPSFSNSICVSPIEPGEPIPIPDPIDPIDPDPINPFYPNVMSDKDDPVVEKDPDDSNDSDCKIINQDGITLYVEFNDK